MSILKKPLVTEKYAALNEKLNQYGFIVDRKATKEQIKAEIEKVYEVAVTGVRTMVYAGKVKNRYTKRNFVTGRTPGFKKAIVTLKDGDQIDFYSNI
jgi:large subunit ribosomal protein L23